MTNSYLISINNTTDYYNAWEKCLIAPKLTIKNFVNELHYYIRLYVKENLPFYNMIQFLFLNIVQRILYATGSFIIKIKKTKKE